MPTPTRAVLAALAFGAHLGACTCAQSVGGLRYACATSGDCAPGNVCRAAECHPEDLPAEVCFDGEDPRACETAGCAQVCGDAGLFEICTPTSGPGLDSNHDHCGACERSCSPRLSGLLTCLAGRCSCAVDADCPTGTVCAQGGLCAEADGSDSCARIPCAPGTVCRAGACAAVSCASGCAQGEVCDGASALCRPVDACRLPAACPDAGVCEGPLKPDGEPCDDTQPCSFADRCTAGACAGTAYSCPLPGLCQLAVACSGDGGCAVTPRPDGTSCDDGLSCTSAEACSAGSCVGTALTSYPDLDGDGLGDSAAAQSVCPVPAANVLDGGDCDDGSANVFRTVPALRDDPDQDGYSNAPAASYCVGDTFDSDAGRTYYRAADAGYPYTTSYLGADCDSANASRYRTVSVLVVDADRDGYPPNNTQTSQCVGASTTVAGRTYYSDGSGGNWMPVADCINRNGGGTQCQAPFDVDDGNSAVH